jgi:hypothetical protein
MIIIVIVCHIFSDYLSQHHIGFFQQAILVFNFTTIHVTMPIVPQFILNNEFFFL